jgi:hypothetical protein
MLYWKVTVTNPAGNVGDLLAIPGPSQAEAEAAALAVTPGNLDTLAGPAEQITEAEYTRLNTPGSPPE